MEQPATLRGWADLLVLAGGDLLQEVSYALAWWAHEPLLCKEVRHMLPWAVVHNMPCRGNLVLSMATYPSQMPDQFVSIALAASRATICHVSLRQSSHLKALCLALWMEGTGCTAGQQKDVIEEVVRLRRRLQQRDHRRESEEVRHVR